MQLITSCMQCQVEDGIPNFSALTLMRIPDDGVIELTCNRQHRTFTIIQNMKFELLSDLALQAIVDGYYREAISSFTAALERLYEFFVEATCRKNGIDREALSVAWKPLANLSERQLGAFVAVHLIETGEPPKLLPQTQTKLRNEVIHKGKFPERGEAVAFGQAVCDCATPLLVRLASDAYAETIPKLVGERLRDRRKAAAGSSFSVATGAMSTLFCLTKSPQPIDLGAEVPKYADRPGMAQAVRESHAFGAVLDLLRDSATSGPADADDTQP
jgi:hypothetical protein